MSEEKKVLNINDFRPVLDRIVIKEISREQYLGIEEPPEGEKRLGSLLISEDTKEFNERVCYGLVISIGEDVTKFPLSNGDTIAYQYKFGVEISTGEVNPKDKYRILTQVDILAIMDKRD